MSGQEYRLSGQIAERAQCPRVHSSMICNKKNYKLRLLDHFGWYYNIGFYRLCRCGIDKKGTLEIRVRTTQLRK